MVGIRTAHEPGLRMAKCDTRRDQEPVLLAATLQLPRLLTANRDDRRQVLRAIGERREGVDLRQELRIVVTRKLPDIGVLRRLS